MQIRMQRKLFTAFLWFLLVLHPLVGMGMAQGAVLCLSSDGHFAVEAPHNETGCLTARNIPYSPLSETSLINPRSSHCSDISVFADGSHLTIPSGEELLPPACQLTVVFVSPRKSTSVSQTRHFQAALVPPPSSLASLRNIILLV